MSGLLSSSAFSSTTLPVAHRFAAPARTISRQAFGQTLTFAQPITLTPFASARPCTARCTFCSETLQHKKAKRLSQSLRPGPEYFDQLAFVLSELADVPLGISLSGLEATDDVDWLLSVLATFSATEAAGATYTSRVLYSNATGLVDDKGARLLPALRDFGLTRVEISRHDPTESRNDAIMRFRPNVTVATNAGFERAVKETLSCLPVRLVCILQKPGVSSFDDVLRYLAWARTLGVRDVVFREFSRLGTGAKAMYKKNRTLTLIEDGRVPIEPLVDAALKRDDFAPRGFENGYYYWNYRAEHEGVLVTFETSDYTTMKREHDRVSEQLVQKLVFHANGNLCSDWDPDRDVVWKPKTASP